MKLVNAAVAVLTLLVGSQSSVFAQPNFPTADDFQYSPGTDLGGGSAGDWLYTGTPGDLVLVASFGLDYTSYPGSGVGNAAFMRTERAGIGLAFQEVPNEVTSGSVYYSMMILVDSASQNGSNIITLSSTEASEKGGLLWLKDVGVAWEFGISKVTTAGAAAPVYTSGSYTKGDTHVVVVRYVFNTGGTTDDVVDLWVDPDLSGSEPPATLSLLDNGIGDAAGFNFLEFFEQFFEGTTSDSTVYFVDGVRIGPTWADAPLPVQLTDFAAAATLSGVELTWSTESEINNYGFEVERREVGGPVEWSRIGFVQGAGTSSGHRDYSFTDAEVSNGRYAYRIKQVDLNGAFTYYGAMEVEVGIAPKDLALEPNFPNPFNPTTSIAFTVPHDGRATLKVFNMLGQEVAVLFDEEATAGRAYRQTFDASSLPTGVYVSRLEFGGQMVMRKMMFVK